MEPLRGKCWGNCLVLPMDSMRANNLELQMDSTKAKRWVQGLEFPMDSLRAKRLDF
jgi:hypothetical protein